MDTDAPAPEPAPGSRRRWLALGGVGAVIVVAFLAFGVFGVHTLFIDDEVSESGPTFDSGATSDPTAAPDLASPSTTTSAGADPLAPTTTATATATATTTTPPAPQVQTVSSGDFTGVDHPGTGRVALLSDGSQTFVRFDDDFSTDNGPDLYAVVYVGDQRLELGVLKGNRGSQNYELPAAIDPTTVTTVAVWCKRFDSTFTEAALS